MNDDDLVPGDDLTRPARQGEVPDWFSTSEESEPVVVPEPAEPASGNKLAQAVPIPDTLPEPIRDQPPGDESYADEEIGEQPVAETMAENPPADYIPYADVRRFGTRRRRTTGPPLQPQLSSSRGYGCADVITAIFLLLTVLVASVTILLIANPQSALNPFPAPTFPAVIVLASPLPTETATETFTPEPYTPTPLPSLTPTATPLPTATATPTATDTPVVGGGGVAPTQAQTESVAAPLPQYTLSPFPFTVKPIRFTANTTKDSCQWQSIAGTVVDLAGKPIKGLAIRVAGSNGNIDEVHYSGTALTFGESGFEVFLGAIPREDQYTIQLLGRTGAPISDTIEITTRTGCEQNVVIVNFVQNHPY
jgi:hypothetical protein